MYHLILIELFHLISLFAFPIYTIFLCSCNDREREASHLERRQALRDRQRDAVISGRSVRSVIETEVEPETNQCPRMTCVQMTPRLKNHSGPAHSEDVYNRLNENDEKVRRMDKEKPPSVFIPKSNGNERKSERRTESEEYPDERDKLSAEKETNSNTL